MTCNRLSRVSSSYDCTGALVAAGVLGVREVARWTGQNMSFHVGRPGLHYQDLVACLATVSMTSKGAMHSNVATSIYNIICIHIYIYQNHGNYLANRF